MFTRSTPNMLKMKIHQLVFIEIKKLLKKWDSIEIDEYEDGTHLTIVDSDIWIASDERELTVGNGLVHQHYDPDYDDLESAVEHFFNLLTCRIKRTDFFKGEFAYKHRIELELPNGTYENLGTALTWLFPFWRRTTEQITYENPLLNIDEIQNDLVNIKKLLATGTEN